MLRRFVRKIRTLRKLAGIIAAQPNRLDEVTQKLDFVAEKINDLNADRDAHYRDEVIPKLDFAVEQINAINVSQSAHYTEILNYINQVNGKIDQITDESREIKNINFANNSIFESGIDRVKQTVNMIAANRKPEGRIKVVFLIHNFSAWDSLSDVYDSMLSAEDFDPLVISIKRRFPGENEYSFEEETHEKLTQYGIDHIRFSMDDDFEGLDILKAIAPDIIFRQSQWDNDIPAAYHVRELRFAKLCYVPYAILSPIETREPNTDPNSDSMLHRSVWRYFTSSLEEKDRLQFHNRTEENRVVVTGHPKVERLVRVGNENPLWPIEARSSDPAFRLIWSPHHTVDNHWRRFGTFHQIYNQMLEWAQFDKSIDFVLSAHPATFAKLREPGGVLPVSELDQFLDAWSDLDNTAIIEPGNYAGVFAASDALLTDGISFLTEYQFFQKPIIFLERPDHVPFNEIGERVVLGTNRFSEFIDAKEMVYKLKNGFSDEREIYQLQNKLWLSSNGNSVFNILNSIRDGIRSL